MLATSFLPFLATFALAGSDCSAASSTLIVDCPPLAKLICGESLDPSNTGLPTVTGACDENPVITWTDNVVNASCAAQRFEKIIYRTFTVTDSCGNTGSCTQQIDVIKKVVVLDLHPRSCPNPFNRSGIGNGVYPAAILGTSDCDVTQIDPNSVQLWIMNCAYGPVVPLRFDYEDVSTPYDGGEECGCTTAGPDGRLDLTFKFDRRAVRNGLGLNAYPNFSYVHLMITGRTFDGCGFIGSDCVRVQ